MLDSRRKFLGSLGLGMIGVGLFLPEDAEAFGRRRSPYCIQSGHRNNAGDLHVTFPNFAQGGLGIVGGGFWSWGSVAQNITLGHFVITKDDPNNVANPTPYGTTTSGVQPDPNLGLGQLTWANVHYGLSINDEFFLYVPYTKPNDPNGYKWILGKYTAVNP
jgi:hypothetical protein